ncbi:hypothetical protein [Streptomyces salinarius]|nr:hypothetical protein [Streptomyces salinarius]
MSRAARRFLATGAVAFVLAVAASAGVIGWDTEPATPSIAAADGVIGWD